MTRSAGNMVGESVRLSAPLAGDESGNLWLADHLDYKRQVVVRFMTGEEVPADDPEALVTFVEEASQSAKIDSEHVARAYEHGLTDDGTPYVVSELLAGETLRSRLNVLKRLSPREAVPIITQIADALARAHEAGVVHGSLSPENILLKEGRQPDVKVLNFSVAPHIPINRTSDYISPEQYLGKPVDGRADIWALGVISYEMLAGERPFDGESRRLLSWELTPVSSLLRTASEWLDEWFSCVLARKPEDRFATAQQASEQFNLLVNKAEPRTQESPETAAPMISQPVIDVGDSEPSQPPPEDDVPDVVIEVED